MANIIDDIHRRIANRQIALVPLSANRKREAQFKVSDANSIPRLAQAPTMDKTSFRYIPKPKEDVRYPIFRFRITRDDGTILGPTSFSIHTGITVVQESKVNSGTYEPVAEAHGYDPSLDPEDASYWVHNPVTKLWEYSRGEDPYKVKFSYDLLTQIWILTYSSSWGFTPNNPYKTFWAFFHGEDSVQCMYIKSSKSNPAYPYKHVTSGHPEYVYKTVDFYKDEYKIRPGFYEVRVPYYKMTVTHTGNFYIPPPATPPSYCDLESSQGPCYTNKNITKFLTVESSIDYTASFRTEDNPSVMYYGYFLHYGECTLDHCVDCEAAWAFNGWAAGGVIAPGEGEAFVPDQVLTISSNGDYSTNINTNPVDSTKIVSPTPYKVSTIVHQMDVYFTGPDPLQYEEICGDDVGSKTYPLPFKIFRVRFYLNAAYNP